jgi:hypothetical protein
MWYNIRAIGESQSPLTIKKKRGKHYGREKVDEKAEF